MSRLSNFMLHHTYIRICNQSSHFNIYCKFSWLGGCLCVLPFSMHCCSLPLCRYIHCTHRHDHINTISHSIVVIKILCIQIWFEYGNLFINHMHTRILLQVFCVVLKDIPYSLQDIITCVTSQTGNAGSIAMCDHTDMDMISHLIGSIMHLQLQPPLRLHSNHLLQAKSFV